MKYDYLIVGCGLFGAVFAQKAIEAGKSVIIIDKRSHIGGNCYTEEIEGVHVHKYGAHIFHTSDEEVWEYINRFAKFNNYIHRVEAIYQGIPYSLPFNMKTFERM
jgi:UDP-galactopyranose mutase